MTKITTLYGVEVIVHFATPEERKEKGLIMPSKLTGWVEGTVVRKGIDCKKPLDIGDTVAVAREVYEQAPLLLKSQFAFDKDLPKGELKMMSEYLIAMKIVKEDTNEDINTEV